MSYTKQVWNTGEKITADKLNHMEDGIENVSRVLVVTASDGDYGNLDHTWNEINNAVKAVFSRTINGVTHQDVITQTFIDPTNNRYAIQISMQSGRTTLFETTDPDGYPSAGGGK